jgi:hypothetical protein
MTDADHSGDAGRATLPEGCSEGSSCPLCGSANACAIAAAEEAGESAEDLLRTHGAGGPLPCWCFSEPARPDVLARVPPALRGVRCVCRKCLRGAPAPSVGAGRTASATGPPRTAGQGPTANPATQLVAVLARYRKDR